VHSDLDTPRRPGYAPPVGAAQPLAVRRRTGAEPRGGPQPLSVSHSTRGISERSKRSSPPAPTLELRQAALGVRDQAVHIDAHAAAAERFEVADPPPPEPPRPVRVPASQGLEAHADLQDPLVEVADRVGLLDPLELERLVLLEEVAAVELLDALPEARWWRVAASARVSAAAGSVSGRRGSDHCGASLRRPAPAPLLASGSTPSATGNDAKARPVAGVERVAGRCAPRSWPGCRSRSSGVGSVVRYTRARG
jgi:hypothetical protein